MRNAGRKIPAKRQPEAMVWKAANRRWGRKRKLLKKLQLRYPNDDELSQLAALAKIESDKSAAFSEYIRSIILDAHLNDRSLRGLSTPKVRRILNEIARKAQQLRTELQGSDVDSGGSAEHAGFLLEMELSKLKFKRSLFLLPEYVVVLGQLSDAAKAATSSLRSKRAPKAFDAFVDQLIINTWTVRGKWTVYQSGNTWRGTLVEALAILQKYLPPEFLPPGELGRSVQYIRNKLKDHITKHRDRHD